MKKLIIVFLCLVSLLGIIPNINDTKVNADVQTDTSVGTNSIVEQFNYEVAQNGGLQKIDNLVLKELIHKYFPLGEEKESQILGELNRQRMSGKNPLLVFASLITAGGVIYGIVQDGLSHQKWLDSYSWEHGNDNHWRFCNHYSGWGRDCKDNWQQIQGRNGRSRWFKFNNKVLEVGYKWVKYGTHWMFLDDDRGYETNEWGYVIIGNNSNVRKNYHFDNNGYCTNP